MVTLHIVDPEFIVFVLVKSKFHLLLTFLLLGLGVVDPSLFIC